jgi:hypothetical protein
VINMYAPDSHGGSRCVGDLQVGHLMAGKNTAVFGIYRSADHAEQAVDTLIAAGFASGDISVLLPDVRSTREFAHEKDTKAPEGATAGVTAGGVIGGTIGVLAGVGLLAIPGLGPFIAAGPIMVGLAGLGVGGAVGGLVGALIGMGIPEYEAKRYEGHVKNGGNLLSVHCDTSDQVKRAKDLLKSSGALDIASTSESSAAGAANEKDRSDPRMTSGSRCASGGRSATELGNSNAPPYTATERRTSDRRRTTDRRKSAGPGNASASPTPSTPPI